MQNKSQSKVENWFLPERGNLVSRRSIFVCLSHNKNCWYRLVSKFRVLQLGQGRTETINAFIERYNLLLFTIRHAVIHALPSLTVSRSRRSALNPDIRPVSYKFYEGKLHFSFWVKPRALFLTHIIADQAWSVSYLHIPYHFILGLYHMNFGRN